MFDSLSVAMSLQGNVLRPKVHAEGRVSQHDWPKPSEEGKGARFEGSAITEEIYEKASENEKFMPILLNGRSMRATERSPATLHFLE